MAVINPTPQHNLRGEKGSGLDVAVCPGCGHAWTRREMAARMWADEDRVFRCTCEFEWNASPYRPLTLQEQMDGRTSLPCAHIDLDAYTRTVYEMVRQMLEDSRRPALAPLDEAGLNARLIEVIGLVRASLRATHRQMAKLPPETLAYNEAGLWARLDRHALRVLCSLRDRSGYAH